MSLLLRPRRKLIRKDQKKETRVLPSSLAASRFLAKRRRSRKTSQNVARLRDSACRRMTKEKLEASLSSCTKRRQPVTRLSNSMATIMADGDYRSEWLAIKAIKAKAKAKT